MSRINEAPVASSNRTVGAEHLYADRVSVYPKAVHGPVRRIKWAVLIVLPGRLLPAALAALESRPGPAGPGGAARYLRSERFYFFNLEFWPQDIYYLTGLLILGAVGAVPGHQPVRPGVVRLHLPADGVDRPVHVGRARDRRRPQRTHAARRRRRRISTRSGARLAKHAVWLGIAFWTGGAWIMYYVDAPTVTREFWTGTASTAGLFLHRPVHRDDLLCWPAGRASRSAPTCAPGRASSRRCWTSRA